MAIVTTELDVEEAKADIEEDEPRIVDNCLSHWSLRDMLALRQSATRVHPRVRVVGEGQSGKSTESTLHKLISISR